MTRPLLETKIRIPPIARPLVDRSRLTSTLEEEIARFKIVTVSAPAGYGKTTLLAQWAQSSCYPVAWLSLSEDDDDFEFFFRYLVAAWELVQPEIMESRLGLLLNSCAPDHDAILTTFINAGLHQATQTVFVLDDYQSIRDASIHDALAHLIDHLTPAFRIVIASRGEPPLPLARYRARRELLEITSADLQFLPAESDALLNGLLKLELAGDQITHVQSQTEGWAAGLQLAGLTLSRQRETPPLQLTGQHRHIADYLAQEVLRDLSPETRQFLLQTSILETLSAELCNAVTGQFDGQEMLERIERDGLFLAPLDDQREWYRYHPIFATVAYQALQRSFSRDAIDTLHRHAGSWYLEHDLPEPAFRHILAGQDADLMFELFEQYAYAKISSGEVRTVERWFDSLPADWLERRPAFGFYRAMLLLATGSFEEFLRLLDELEHRLATRQDAATAQRGRVIAFRCFLACFQNDLPAAQKYAEQALQMLPNDDFNFRPGIFGALGDTFRRNGLWDDAHAWYLKIGEFANARPVQSQSVHLYGALADLNLRQGRLQEAARNWRQALSLMDRPQNHGRFPLPLTGWVDVRTAELLYEWDQLDDAHRYLKRGLERAELGGDVRTLTAAHLIAARLDLAEGDVEAASDDLARAPLEAEGAVFPEWIALFDRIQVELWLARNQIETASRWAEEIHQSRAGLQEPDEVLEQLTIARVLAFRREHAALDRAMSLLERVLETASEDGRMGIEIEAHAIRALAHQQRGESVSALRSLEQALRRAEPEGFVRLFADLGRPMALLLQEARSRGITPEYVDRLLQACGARATTATQPYAQLPEPLTDREQEIIKLLAIGLTNAEIADQLFISSETVKKHAGNIYAKFGVRNRTEAVSRARELDLLG